MNTKHTPGPWSAEIERTAGDWVAFRITAPPFGGFAPICEACDYAKHPLPNEANAHLIAAAPEMFEALARAIAVLEDIGSGLRYLDQPKGADLCELAARTCREAMAKATGETP